MNPTIKRLTPFFCKALLVLALASCVPSHKAKVPAPEAEVTGPLSSVSGFFSEVQQRVQSPWASDEKAIEAPREIKIGLLLPLSGSSEEVGKHLQDAASLAVFDARMDNLHPVNITLIPKDTSTSATMAVASAAHVIAQGAQRIVGPLFSQSVAEVSKLAVTKNIPVVALTNNRSVANANTTVFGFTPEDQVSSIADYVIKSGAGHLALLAPNDTYGKVVEDAFRKSVTSRGGFVTTVERYGKKPENMAAAAKRIVESYRAQPFKALLIADTPATTAVLVQHLRMQGFDTATIKLLGTALLDDAGDRPDAALLGVMYATTNPANYAAFVKRFETTYGYAPKRIASLAYDAVMVAASEQIQGDYAGRATGAFRITPDGITDRQLAIVAVSATGFNLVRPAARGF